MTGNYWDYPTSSDSVPSNALLAADPGNSANFDQSGCTIGGPCYMTEVGDFENSASPYGTFDQGGNIWEWNEAVVAVGMEDYRGFRGGGWSGISNHMQASVGNSLYPTGASQNVF